MNRLLVCLFCLAWLLSAAGCSALVPCSQDPNCVRILFIGNSYTFVNDLPGMFVQLAKAGGQRVEVGMAAQGGWMLSDHAQSADTLAAIQSAPWQWVVLQEQSQVPAVMAIRNAQMYPPARTLVSLIREQGAEPVFFLAWAHQAGWQEQNLPDYNSMQQNIVAGYMSIVHELDTPVAPVGVAWAEALRQNPQAPLWQADGSHPSLQGTYLAACVFYAALFQTSPAGLSYRAGLSKDEAQWLQEIAAQVVLNNPSQWNLP